MEKTSSERLDKYRAKISDPETIRKREKAKASMIYNYDIASQHQRKVEQAVRDAVFGVEKTAMYMAFGRRVDKCMRTMSSKTQEQEIEIALEVWKMRHLKPRVLNQVLKKIEELNSA